MYFDCSQVLAEKTLKERDSLFAALNALNCPEIIVSKCPQLDLMHNK